MFTFKALYVSPSLCQRDETMHYYPHKKFLGAEGQSLQRGNFLLERTGDLDTLEKLKSDIQRRNALQLNIES